MVHMTFGKKLKELREGKGLAQRQIGAKIEVDGAFISKVEKGEKRINRKHLKKLSELFDVQLSELETLWLADKVFAIVKDEDEAKSVIKEVEKRI